MGYWWFGQKNHESGLEQIEIAMKGESLEK